MIFFSFLTRWNSRISGSRTRSRMRGSLDIQCIWIYLKIRPFFPELNITCGSPFTFSRWNSRISGSRTRSRMRDRLHNIRLSNCSACHVSFRTRCSGLTSSRYEGFELKKKLYFKNKTAQQTTDLNTNRCAALIRPQADMKALEKGIKIINKKIIIKHKMVLQSSDLNTKGCAARIWPQADMKGHQQ